ncbi:MAG: hypothetical protein ACK5II_08385 [Paracoccus sp. (in: a-proteobacteria)]
MTVTLIFPLISLATSMLLVFYCYVLSRRLRRLNNLETGLGGAIAVMTGEISRLDQAIRRAKTEAEVAAAELASAIDIARNEKAYWALQSELSKPGSRSSRRLRPRSILMEDADA